MSIFDEVVLDVNPRVEGGCVINPETRDVAGSVGAFTSRNAKTSGRPILPEQVRTALQGAYFDPATAEIVASGGGSYSVDEGVLNWTPESVTSTLQLTFPALPAPTEAAFAVAWVRNLALTTGAIRAQVKVSLGGAAAGEGVIECSPLVDGEAWAVFGRRIYGTPSDSAVITLSVKAGSGLTGNPVSFRGFTLGEPAGGGESSRWHPALAGRKDLLPATVVSDRGAGVRFEGGAEGGWAYVDLNEYGSSGAIHAVCKDAAVRSQDFSNTDYSMSGYFTDPELHTGTFAFSVPGRPIQSAVGFVAPGGYLEVYGTSNGTCPGSEWVSGDSGESLPNVLSDGYLYTGTILDFDDIPEEFTFVVVADDVGAHTSVFEAYVQFSPSTPTGSGWPRGWSTGNGEWDTVPRAIAFRASADRYRIDTREGVSEEGKGYLNWAAIGAGLKVSRALLWPRHLTDEELMPLLEAPARLLSWTAPKDGGSPITGYQVFRLEDGSLNVQTLPAGTLSYSTGAYEGPVWVAAVNAVGVGTPAGVK